MMQSYADCWLVHLADWRKRLECWLCSLLLRKDGHPPKQNLTVGIPVVCLDSVLIPSILGDLGPAINNVFLGRKQKPTGTLNGFYFVLYSNLSNTIKHVGLDCSVLFGWSIHAPNTLINGWFFSILQQKNMSFPSVLAFISIAELSNKYCSITPLCYKMAHSSTRV